VELVGVSLSIINGEERQFILSFGGEVFRADHSIVILLVVSTPLCLLWSVAFLDRQGPSHSYLIYLANSDIEQRYRIRARHERVLEYLIPKCPLCENHSV
jgi:hypothetical protein